MKYVYTCKGVTMGENTVFYSVKVSQSRKGDRFFIGSNCVLTGCTLLGHDASPALFIEDLQNFKEIYKRGARRSFVSNIYVGNNVFIGVGAIIMPGVVIGNDVVIAAGSVVSKNVEDGSVMAGNTAKKIKFTSELISKYKEILNNKPDKF